VGSVREPADHEVPESLVDHEVPESLVDRAATVAAGHEESTVECHAAKESRGLRHWLPSFRTPLPLMGERPVYFLS